jgi:hypothetical protein
MGVNTRKHCTHPAASFDRHGWLAVSEPFAIL